MSYSVECPLCKYTSKDIAHPSPTWGYYIDDVKDDIAYAKTMGKDARSSMNIMRGATSRMFICPCNKAVWLEDKGWFVLREEGS